MATELERAIAKVRATRGLNNAEKKQIIQQLKKDANKNGDLGAGDRATLRQGIAAARANNVQEEPTPDPPPVDPVTPDNPPGEPAEGYYWTKDSAGTWIQLPLAPQEPAEPPSQTGGTTTGGDDRGEARVFLEDLLKRFGLESLLGSVESLITKWGTNTDIIAIELRKEDAYLERFAGNLARTKNGLNMLTEAEYLSTEDAIKTQMRMYGLSDSFMSQDYVGNLISQDVSASEVDSRLAQAERIVKNSDPMVVDSLRRLYGANIGDMFGYVLDADTALRDIERKVNAGITARIGETAGLNLDRSLAEQIGDLTGGNESALRPALQRAGTMADSARKLAAIDDIDITDAEVVEGEFGFNKEAREKTDRLQSRERARFSGRSGLSRNTLGRGNTI